MTTPAIGICAAIERVSWGVWSGYEVTLAPRGYVTAVQSAGGLGIVLPPDPAAVEDPDLLLDRVDALMLAGGADLDPASYGAEPHAETKGTWPERDRFELALTRRALEREMPVLGICRGMQLLNVALGGTLVQHLPEALGSEVHRTLAGTFGEHEVRLEPGIARPRGGRDRGPRRQVPSSPGRRPGRRGPAGQRLVGARRPDRGDRAARQALRPRPALAPGGGSGQPPDRGPGRGRAWRLHPLPLFLLVVWRP